MEKRNKIISNYGIIFTLQEFIDLCKNDLLKDSDGYGLLSDGQYVDAHREILPSYVVNGNIDPKIKSWPEWATHICWNK